MDSRATTEELERYAAIRAAIDLGEDKDAVLREHAFTHETWPAFEERMIEVVADQVDRGEVTGLHAFQRVYDDKRGAAPRANATAADPPEPLGDATEEIDASAIRAQLLAAPVPFGAVAPPVTPPVVTPLVVVPAAMAPSPPPAVAPPQEPAAPVSPQTMMTDGGAIRALLEKGALPFAPSLLRDAPPPPRAATQSPAPQRGLPRMTMDTDPALVGRASTPFDSKTAPSVAPFDAPTLPRTEQLPEPAVILEMARSRSAVPKVTAPPRADAGKGPAVPFEKPGAAQAADPLMPLERYAETSALLERERDPMKTFARLGTTPESWMTTVRAYARLFASDPSVEARFNALMKKHKP